MRFARKHHILYSGVQWRAGRRFLGILDSIFVLCPRELRHLSIGRKKTTNPRLGSQKFTLSLWVVEPKLRRARNDAHSIFPIETIFLRQHFKTSTESSLKWPHSQRSRPARVCTNWCQKKDTMYISFCYHSLVIVMSEERHLSVSFSHPETFSSGIFLPDVAIKHRSTHLFWFCRVLRLKKIGRGNQMQNPEIKCSASKKQQRHQQRKQFRNSGLKVQQSKQFSGFEWIVMACRASMQRHPNFLTHGRKKAAHHGIHSPASKPCQNWTRPWSSRSQHAFHPWPIQESTQNIKRASVCTANHTWGPLDLPQHTFKATNKTSDCEGLWNSPQMIWKGQERRIQRKFSMINKHGKRNWNSIQHHKFVCCTRFLFILHGKTSECANPTCPETARKFLYECCTRQNCWTRDSAHTMGHSKENMSPGQKRHACHPRRLWRQLWWRIAIRSFQAPHSPWRAFLRQCIRDEWLRLPTHWQMNEQGTCTYQLSRVKYTHFQIRPETCIHKLIHHPIHHPVWSLLPVHQRLQQTKSRFMTNTISASKRFFDSMSTDGSAKNKERVEQSCFPAVLWRGGKNRCKTVRVHVYLAHEARDDPMKVAALEVQRLIALSFTLQIFIISSWR